MVLPSQNTKQKLPFPYDDVFDALLNILQDEGFRIKSSDKLIGRITATTNFSIFSFGEIVIVTAEKIDKNNTIINIESSLKFGANIAGSHRHIKNFNTIIESLSNYLQSSLPSHKYITEKIYNGEIHGFFCPECEFVIEKNKFNNTDLFCPECGACLEET